jgi:hypothetical protein
MYYHLRPDGDLLHIDYWWYFRYNVSPVKTTTMCLAGFSVTELSCFDHESDWEGVTVTVENTRSDDASLPEAVAVTYSGHAWRYRLSWPELEAHGVIVSETHPLVYVAFGSHASYPVPCGASEPAPLSADRDCWQGRYREEILVIGVPLPDGRRDGEAPWIMNDPGLCAQVACLAPLPVDRDDKPTSWNAYPGRWGRAECTFGVGLICVRTRGPESPSMQKRYLNPGAAPDGSLGDDVATRPPQ